MALASRTPLMPSAPGATSGVPSSTLSAKFSSTPECCARNGELELDGLLRVERIEVDLAA